MVPVKCALLIASIFYINQRCQAIDCNKPSCECTADTACALNCRNMAYKCQSATLTCKEGQDCTAYCDTAYDSVCQGATIDASTAIDVNMDCYWYNSCNSANVMAGTGDITINCDGQNSCNSMTVNAANARNVQINCPNVNACKLLDVTCGTGDCYVNCGTSAAGNDKCSQLKLRCSSGDCRINCNDNGHRHCNLINVFNAASAKSFTCYGDYSTECAYAPASFTAKPTTTNPTTAPTKPPSTQPTKSPSNEPTTKPTNKPTVKPTTAQPTEAAVSVELEIIGTDVTNNTVTHRITEIITDYLQTQLKVNGNFSLSVDVINDKVVVTISGEDTSDLDETRLIAYLQTQLAGTDIQVVEQISTTVNEQINRTEGETDGMSGGIIALIVLVIFFVIVLIIAGLFGYKRKMRYGGKSVIEVQMNEKHSNNGTVGAVNRMGSIHETDAMGFNNIFNEDSLDEMGTEGTGSGNIGENMNTDIIQAINGTNGGYDMDVMDDTDVLHEVNKQTKGNDGDMDATDDIIIEDETIGNDGDMNIMDDTNVLHEVNKNTKGNEIIDINDGTMGQNDEAHVMEGEILMGDDDMDASNMMTIK